MPAVSSKSPTGKGSPAQAAKPISKLSMQSSPEHSNLPRHKTNMTSVQHPVQKDLTPVSSKGGNALSSHDAKLKSDTTVSQTPCCSSEIQIQIAAAPVQLTLKTYPQDSPPAAQNTTGAPMSTPMTTTGSAAQATYPLNETKTASAPSSTGHQHSTSAVSSLNNGFFTPGRRPDSEEVPVASTGSAEVSLDTPPKEARRTEEITNVITAVSAPSAMPAATSAAAEGAVAQQVPDSLQNPTPQISSDACSGAQQGQHSSGAPTSAEVAAMRKPALRHADYKPTSVSTPRYIYTGLPAATGTSPRAAVFPVDALSSELAVASHTAVAPASMQTDSQADITGHALPTNLLRNFSPQAAASITTLLGQPLTAPAPAPAANCPTNDEQAKQAELPEEAAVCTDLSDSATAPTALCNALALSLPASISAVPTAAAAAAATATTTAASVSGTGTGLAGLVPHTSASPLAKLADPLAVPIKLEAVCMPFNLMDPSILPAVSPRASAASASLHSRAGTPHVGFVLGFLELLCCNNLCCVCNYWPCMKEPGLAFGPMHMLLLVLAT